MQIEHEKNNLDALLKCLLLFFLSFYFLFLAIESSASSLLPQTLRERLRSSLEAQEKPQQGHDSSRLYSLKAKGFPYSLRQDPGPHNALGRIKFMFPNKYNVYLHDTPSRELFGKSSRSFSSGCVRIEKPVELAAYFLLRNTQWSYEAIQGAIDKGTEQTIKLGQPVPVHLLYWTAFPDDSGSIQFRPDIYGRDLLLKEAWLSATPPTDNPLQ